ncbi:MAG TPA: TolC family protein [Polyangiaceae bacterium]|jgi:outer membrane protein|nr:TolC family protein [Polyangiaceae bacterium]
MMRSPRAFVTGRGEMTAVRRGGQALARALLWSRRAMLLVRLLSRLRVSITWAVGVTWMAASPARGDTPQPDKAAAAARTMTLAEALAYARAHQPAVAEALARVALRERQAAVPTAQWLPKVTAGAQLFAMTANNTTGTFVPLDGLDVPRIGGTAATATGTFSPYASTFVGIGANQELFDFGRIGAQRAAADALVTAEQRNAETARLDVDFGVEEAFFSVLAAKGVVRAAEEAYSRSLVHRDLAQRGVDAGLRSPIELTRAQADLARYDVGRVRAHGGVEVAQSVLAAAVGVPDGALDAADEPLRPADVPTLHDAIALAESRNPWLARAIAELAAAEARTRAVGAELRPDLSVTATLSGRAGGAPPASNAIPTGDGWLPAVPNWDAGLLFTWPLFDGVVIARRDAAAEEERVRKSEVDVARLQIVGAVREAYEQVGVARATVVALQNATVTARANWEQADARFRAGIGNAVEAADAEAVRATAEIQLALGEFEVERIRAAFGRAIAEGL